MALICKTMIRYVLPLNSNGLWEKTQLFQHLQDIIAKHPVEL